MVCFVAELVRVQRLNSHEFSYETSSSLPADSAVNRSPAKNILAWGNLDAVS
jgi:hypothetical protein